MFWSTDPYSASPLTSPDDVPNPSPPLLIEIDSVFHRRKESLLLLMLPFQEGCYERLTFLCLRAFILSARSKTDQ